MSPDDPFDVEADDPAPRRPVRPPQQPPRSASFAPGRRPVVRGTSRARTGGSAQPLDQQRPARPRTTGAEPVRRRPAAAAPPSFAPGGERERADVGASPRTRVMPAAGSSGPGSVGATPRSVSARTRADRAGTRPPDAPPGGAGTRPPREPRPGRGRRRLRRVVIVLVVLLVLVLAWPIGLAVWANGKINHVEAGTGGLTTAGTTYLLAGSDSRADGTLGNDYTAGARTDTIMLLTVPPSGTSSLISLPRDTYVDVPGEGPRKLNSAYAIGGPPLLVETVEQLTGIGVDHYVEIGMGGVAGLVDAVGGVRLCLDYDVDDPDSDLVWTAGCHMADGETALAFARMRKADPLGDIGRTQRQQQVIQAVTAAIADPSLAVRPGEQVRLTEAGLDALAVSDGTGILDLGAMALGFREATGPDGVRGAPPIADMNYRPGSIGSTVLLDEQRAPAFFAAVADGTITTADLDDLG